MKNKKVFDMIYSGETFSRLDDSDDSEFFGNQRIVDHLDSFALDTIKKLVEELVTEDAPMILDLMAGSDSHIPDSVKPQKLVGLGLNEEELKENRALSEYVIRDLNKTPELPFEDETFDVVLNTRSIGYLTMPFEVFAEVGRVLKPGGLFLVIFSNRMHPPKVIRLWRESLEAERVMFVEDLFDNSEEFEKYKTFTSTGRPRPDDDKYADRGNPGEPVYALYADKVGGDADHAKRPELTFRFGPEMDLKELKEKQKTVKDTTVCPYCDEKLKKWSTPEAGGSTWGCETQYVCFNDSCPKFVNGFDTMVKQGNYGFSYRMIYNPANDTCKSLPVNSHDSMKEGIQD